jgi:hypothetical protein
MEGKKLKILGNLDNGLDGRDFAIRTTELLSHSFQGSARLCAIPVYI